MFRIPKLGPTAAAALVALALAPAPGAGQGAPLTVEVRVGAALPQGTLADGAGVGEGVGAGAAFGLEVTLGSAGRRTLYAGFSQARFGCGDAGCPSGEPYVATGVNLGFRFSLVRGGSVIPWVGAGVLTNRVESPGVTGSPAGVSSLGYGGEASVGLYVATGGSLAFTPAVRYSRTRTELPGGSPLALRYLVADLGLVLSF